MAKSQSSQVLISSKLTASAGLSMLRPSRCFQNICNARLQAHAHDRVLGGAFEGQCIRRQFEGVEGCCVDTGDPMSSLLVLCNCLACRRVDDIQKSFKPLPHSSSSYLEVWRNHGSAIIVYTLEPTKMTVKKLIMKTKLS